MNSATNRNARLRFGLLATTTAIAFFVATPNQTRALDANANANLEQPFWSSSKMANEPVLFIKATNAVAAAGSLLFTPTANLRVTHPDRKMIYVEGKDYIWKPGTSTIELTPYSRIPSLTQELMNPPAGSPNSRDGQFFSEQHFFHDHQVMVSYDHEDTWPIQPTAPEPNLSRTVTKLRQKQSLKVVSLGDSITQGYNASGFVSAPPYQAPYPNLVSESLKRRFSCTTTLVNLAVAGKTSAWGLTQVDMVANEKPDLVFLAFGMNDTEPAAEFLDQMKQLVEAVQKSCPDSDIILVAPMTSNPALKRGTTRFPEYRDALWQLRAPGIALADVTTPWMKLLKHKRFSDLSGNNINHPNDFTHRLYAWVILSLFPEK